MKTVDILMFAAATIITVSAVAGILPGGAP